MVSTVTDNLINDFASLRREGIRHLEKMIGSKWSDFNTHDPGITILEQACYAMTDLLYRIDFALPDLLAECEGDWTKDFFRPSEILTTNPVTISDLRKLAMDVDGVKNAWVELLDKSSVPLFYHPGKQHLTSWEEQPYTQAVNLKGLYKIWIEKSDLSDIDGSKIRQDVMHRLHANRGLCEDYEDIRILKDKPIKISARIEIGPLEDAESLLADIYQKLADYISPRIPFYTLSGMLEAGKRIDEIFDGPKLMRGFIDTAELEKHTRRTEIHSSDVISTIMSVEGVRAVRHIQIGTEAGWHSWVLKLSDNERTPKLDISGSEIVLQRDQIEVLVNEKAANTIYATRLKKSTIFNKLPEQERDILPPAGRCRDVGHYYSIQHQFPLVYGIGPAGLSPTATEQRRAQARQLKAYLMFFDQLLANSFAQLAHARDLFSFSGQDGRTYFANMIEDRELDLDNIRSKSTDEHEKSLNNITETSLKSDKLGERRNRFLNHLLARFAEQLTDYSLLVKSSTEDGGLARAERLIAHKERFLQNYPRVSAGKGCAFNYLESYGPDNTSGLHERIRLKLGLSSGDGEVFHIVEHILLRSISGDEQQDVPFLTAAKSRDPFSLQLTFVFADWPYRFKDPGFRHLIEQTVRDETPAHLTVYIRWLKQDEMETFETVYGDWLEKLRINWAS